MPRVNSLDPARRRLFRICEFIRREMRLRKISQEKMAAALSISQPAFSMKLGKGLFTIEELLRILEVLKSDYKEIGELMCNG